MDIYEIMCREHTRQIVDALNAVGVDAYKIIDQWQKLFDSGELKDLFGHPMDAEATADALWSDLHKCLESTWVSNLTREEAVMIGNTIGVLPNADITLCHDVTVPASIVPSRWNYAHPEEKPIYQNDEHLLP